MRVIIAGTRTFENYTLLKFKCNEILRNVKGEITIIGGEAPGADKLGIKYAKERGYKFKLYPADWDNINTPSAVIKYKNGSAYNANAGFQRNIKMAENADALIVFWNGFSIGTKHMIDTAKLKGLKIRIIKFA